MKKRISFLALLILLTCLAVSGFAVGNTPKALFAHANNPDSNTIVISPFYVQTESISASLSFSGNTANCYGMIDPSGTYGATVTVTLYKQNGEKWDYVMSWSGSGTNGNVASAGGSHTVGSGTYKVTTSGNVGGGLEKPTKSVTKTK